MTVEQIYALTNSAVTEVLGTQTILQEDLSNLVDVGTEVFNANAVDNYVKSLVNHIGKVIFVNRPYEGVAPSVLMDGWEFGSVLEKIQADLPTAVENDTWQLEDNTSYDPNVFHKPSVSATFYNKKVTFEIEMSFCEIQVKESFSSADQLNAFLSMLYTTVENAMSIRVDALIQRTVNNAIAETVFDDYGTNSQSASSGVKAINLLYLYNTKYNTNLTLADAITNPDFIRFAVYTINMYTSRLTRISTLFNIDGKARFTPKSKQHTLMLADFASAADIYLQSDVYHNEYTALNAEVVPYWQGSGTGYALEDISKIYLEKTGSEHEVTVNGVLAVVWDRDALGVTNYDRRVTTNYNPKGEFYNNFYKADMGCFNSTQENVVVFFAA